MLQIMAPHPEVLWIDQIRVNRLSNKTTTTKTRIWEAGRWNWISEELRGGVADAYDPDIMHKIPKEIIKLYLDDSNYHKYLKTGFNILST